MREEPLSVVQVGVGLWGRSWAELVSRARGFRLAGVVDAGAPARDWAGGLGVPVFHWYERERALRYLSEHGDSWARAAAGS